MILKNGADNFLRRSTAYKFGFLLFIFGWFGQIGRGQNPASIHITTEEGLPSNEVYSLLIDSRGFLWVGSDAGICKYDGANFVSFSSPDQHTRSLSGLCSSRSGRVYAYSFNGQLFYVENDSLYEVKSWSGKISQLACDEHGNVWVAGLDGLHLYSEKTDSWQGPLSPTPSLPNLAVGAVQSDGGVFSLFVSGLAYLKEGNFTLYDVAFLDQKPTGEYTLTEGATQPLIVSVAGGEVYALQGGVYRILDSERLTNALSGKKITHAKTFGDDKIWICSYDGLIVYDRRTDQVNTYFAGTILSDVVFDQEGNCWLSSIHDGVFRVPDLDALVWNLSLHTDKTNSPLKMTASGNLIYFSSTNGGYGSLNTETRELDLYLTESRADIQSLNFDSLSGVLYFYTHKYIHTWQDGKKGKIDQVYPPVKDLIRTPHGFILATSRGAFFYSQLGDAEYLQELCTEWSRKLMFDEQTQSLIIATNRGVRIFKFANEKWVQTAHLLQADQIITLAFSEFGFPIYVLCFDGKIYQVTATFEAKLITALEKNAVPTEMIYHQDKLFLATNSGLYIYSFGTGEWVQKTKFSGLASNDVRSLLIVNERLWISTSKGLQSLSLSETKKRNTGKIYLKALFRDDEKIDTTKSIQLNYNQSLSFMLETAHYSSDEKNKYAYRLAQLDSVWSFVPVTSKKITIPSIPSGDFILEIKFVDQAGNDSENVLRIYGTVTPPFWQRWWFYLLIGFGGVILALFLFRYRIKLLKQRQIEELKKMRLENEVRLSQQTALKSQMNPHFIFNVLNSIKGYIYENDKKKAAAYLSDFSDLVRRILILSSQATVRLSEELETLDLYIRLEQMMLDESFQYHLEVAPEIDTHSTQIPVLILQPFIENAFKHGLRHKSGLKKLSLKIYTEHEDAILVVEITDNGIGRKASAELNAKSRQKYKSFAVESSAKRIELINKEQSALVGVEIQDLVDSDKMATGTKVIIKIHKHV